MVRLARGESAGGGRAAAAGESESAARALIAGPWHDQHPRALAAARGHGGAYWSGVPRRTRWADVKVVIGLMTGAALLVTGTLVAAMRRAATLGKPSRASNQAMAPFATVVFGLALAPLPLQFGDRFVVQQGLPEAALGVYVACGTATQLIASQVVTLLSGVLLPRVVRRRTPCHLVTAPNGGSRPPSIDHCSRRHPCCLLVALGNSIPAVLALGASVCDPGRRAVDQRHAPRGRTSGAQGGTNRPVDHYGPLRHLPHSHVCPPH